MADRNDPIAAHTFKLKIQGMEEIDVFDVSGFDNNTEAVEVRQVGPTGKVQVIKQFGNTKWGDITLKRGFTADKTLWNLRQAVIDGDHKAARKDGSIIGLNAKGDAVVQFDFTNGWINSWKSSGINAKSNEPLTEEITLSHEGLKRTL
ncbi:MAG: hypothetical protein JWO59_1033 [Chloroflexi bacterium]|nr:hypothetical protein [Chloroflexota bacterium]